MKVFYSLHRRILLRMLEEKSETRKMIEKFVDENPEAVASLLRNWLSEDWG